MVWMAEPLALPNVEAQTVAYLGPLVSVDVVRVLPDPLPDGPWVRVMLTGGRRINITLVERRVTLECWGSEGAHGDAEAEALGSLTFAQMAAWRTDSTWIPDGEAGWTALPYADTDPVTGRPRYVMTANVRQAVTRL